VTVHDELGAVLPGVTLLRMEHLQAHLPAGSGRRHDLDEHRLALVEGDEGTALRTGKEIVVDARVAGLAPGAHGFHIHEKGDCGSGDGMSTGGHFNPLAKPHGNPVVPDHHAGDMPMLVADASGNAALIVELDVMTVGSGITDIVGRGLIVHKDPDDFTTQPTGNSGARVACGVITRS